MITLTLLEPPWNRSILPRTGGGLQAALATRIPWIISPRKNLEVSDRVRLKQKNSDFMWSTAVWWRFPELKRINWVLKPGIHMKVGYLKTLFTGTTVLSWLLPQIWTPYQRSQLVKKYPPYNLHHPPHPKEENQDSIIVLLLNCKASEVIVSPQASMVAGQGSWDRQFQWVRIRTISTILHISSPLSKCSRIHRTSRRTLIIKQRQSRRGWHHQQVKSSVEAFYQRPRKMV